MRLFVFNDHRIGVLTASGGLADITELTGTGVPARDRMTALIINWPVIRDRVSAVAAAETVGIPVADAVIRAPQPRPPKIVAAPVNYRLHQAEMGGAGGVYSGAAIKTIETYAGFIKASSSVIGPDRHVEIPFPDRRVDHEAELGVVVGRAAAHVARHVRKQQEMINRMPDRPLGEHTTCRHLDSRRVELDQFFELRPQRRMAHCFASSKRQLRIPDPSKPRERDTRRRAASVSPTGCR